MRNRIPPGMPLSNVHFARIGVRRCESPVWSSLLFSLRNRNVSCTRRTCNCCCYIRNSSRKRPALDCEGDIASVKRKLGRSASRPACVRGRSHRLQSMDWSRASFEEPPGERASDPDNELQRQGVVSRRGQEERLAQQG